MAVIVIQKCVCLCVCVSLAVTDRFEDAATRLLCRRRCLFLPLLVAGASAMMSPSSIALRYVYADVDGVVACVRGGKAQKQIKSR